MTASRTPASAAAPGLRRAPIVAMAAVSLGYTAIGVPMGIATLDLYGPMGWVFILVFPAIVLSLTLVGAFVALRVAGNPIGWLLEIAGTLAAPR